MRNLITAGLIALAGLTLGACDIARGFETMATGSSTYTDMIAGKTADAAADAVNRECQLPVAVRQDFIDSVNGASAERGEGHTVRAIDCANVPGEDF